MAKQTIKTTKTVRKRVRKYGGNTGFKKCENCGGDGVTAIRKKKK